MTKKTWIKVRRGLLDAKHRNALGARVWLYLHMLDVCDWDSGTIPTWTDGAHAKLLDMPPRTVQKHRQRLADDGYIRCEQGFQCVKITIINWINPREYSGEVYNKESTYPKRRTHGTQNGVPIQSQNGVPLHKDHINSHNNTQLKSGRKRPARKRDERLDNLAVKTYRELAHNTAPAAMRDDLCAITDVDKWRGVVHDWIGRGYNPRNISGMLEVYNNGWRTNGKRATYDELFAGLEE